MDPVILAGAGAFMTATGLCAAAVHEQLRPGSYQRVELRFGRSVSSEGVGAVLDRVAGLHHFATLAFEVEADHQGIRHYLSTDQATVDAIRSALLAHLPGVQLDKADLTPVTPSQLRGGSVRLRGRLRTLRDSDPEQLTTALLAALQPLGPKERICLRWLIKAGRPMTVPNAVAGQSLESEDRRRLRTKNLGGVLLAHGTLTVTSGHQRRAEHLLARITSVLRTRNTAYGQIGAFPRPKFWLTWLLDRRAFIFGDRYSVAELLGFLAWPVNAPALPGVQLGTSPRRIPSNRLPTVGRVLGQATWSGSERIIAQPVIGALSHSLVAGPTGVGKSTLLINLISQDMAAGRAVVLIDGRGDTAAAVLDRVPENRRDQVIVLDCAQPGPQPGLKLFGSADPELAADVVMGVMADLFSGSWGPLSERWLRAGLVAVAHDPQGTLADVPFVFTDAAYRRRLVSKLRDPLTRSVFAGFEAMSSAERQQQLAAPLNKLGQLLGRPIVRTVLGQVDAQLDFADVLRNNKIVLVSLAPTRVGASAARLLGALTVFALFQSVQGRSVLSERRRRPVLVYIDEPRALGDLPMPLDALLEQARGLGVGLTLAPQSIRQLPPAVQAAALTNIATRIVFRQDADDARLLARDLAGVSPEDLGDLAAYEVVARIGLGPGDLAPPVTIKTSTVPEVTADGRALAEAARNKFGLSSDTVDEALHDRHKPSGKEAPVGRKRRTS